MPILHASVKISPYHHLETQVPPTTTHSSPDQSVTLPAHQGEGPYLGCCVAHDPGHWARGEHVAAECDSSVKLEKWVRGQSLPTCD